MFKKKFVLLLLPFSALRSTSNITLHLDNLALLNFDNKEVEKKSKPLSEYKNNYNIGGESKHTKLESKGVKKAKKAVYDFLEAAQKNNEIYLDLAAATFKQSISGGSEDVLDPKTKLMKVGAIYFNQKCVKSTYYTGKEKMHENSLKKKIRKDCVINSNQQIRKRNLVNRVSLKKGREEKVLRYYYRRV